MSDDADPVSPTDRIEDDASNGDAALDTKPDDDASKMDVDSGDDAAAEKRDGAEAGARSEPLTTEYDNVSEAERLEWMECRGSTCVDSKDAFRRGGFCLKAQRLEAALYWLNLALKDAKIPEPLPEPEPPKPEEKKPAEEEREDEDEEEDEEVEEEEGGDDNEDDEKSGSTKHDDAVTTEEQEDIEVKDEAEEGRRTRSKSRSRSPPMRATRSRSPPMNSPEQSKRSPSKTPSKSPAKSAKGEVPPIEQMQLDDRTEEQPVNGDEEAEEKIEPDADLAKMLVFRARAYQLSNQHASAIRDFSSSLRLTPISKLQVGALVLRAKSYIANGRPDLAVRDYKSAEILDPTVRDNRIPGSWPTMTNALCSGNLSLHWSLSAVRRPAQA